MPASGAVPSFALDISTLFVVATSLTALLGVLFLFAWLQDKVKALAWWGCAYLLGGLSVALWGVEAQFSPPLPPGSTNALLFVSCGIVWNAARLFQGRNVLWGGLGAGATAWFLACLFPEFVQSAAARIVLSSSIVSVYTFLTAAEIWRERRKSLKLHAHAVLVPILHGAVFLIPVPLATLLPNESAAASLVSGWIAVFALEVILYVVGTAFIVFALSKERAVRILKDAASTDELSGLLNRRGFMQAAQALIARQAQKREPVSVLMFDLDHFKKINDRFGHAIGDEALKLFARTASANMRASDIVGRLGGEEFAAILPSGIVDAVSVADRVRVAFQAAGVIVADCPLAATVSIGAACAAAQRVDLHKLLASADAALYRAKGGGRNRVECNDETKAPTEGTGGPNAPAEPQLAPAAAPAAAAAA